MAAVLARDDLPIAIARDAGLPCEAGSSLRRVLVPPQILERSQRDHASHLGLPSPDSVTFGAQQIEALVAELQRSSRITAEHRARSFCDGRDCGEMGISADRRDPARLVQ